MSKEKKEAKKAAKAAKKEEKKANGGGLDQASKQSLIKSIVAVACVGAICFTTTSNIGKVSEAKVAAAEKMYGGSSASSESADDTSSDFSDTSYDDASADTGAADTSADASTDTSADAADTSADTGSSTDSGSTASTPASDNKSSANTGSAQKSKAEIIKLYNDATAKAVSKVAKFEKERTTVEKKYEAGVALKAFKGLVYTFMGVGDSNKFTKAGAEMDKDNYHKYLQASKLTDADVVSATYTLSGANYTIVLKLKDGTSSVKGGKTISSNNTALDRSGLACGQDDKDYWDHKTAQNLMAAIDDVPACASADIDEKYSNATITAVINASTGNIVSITGKFDFHCDINGVMGSSGVAEASSTVIMKDFKW